MLFVLAFLSSFSVFGQHLKTRFLPTSANDFAFIIGYDTSQLGFAGGLHSPSFGMIDLDRDGVDELVAKDAFSDREMVFKRNKGNAKYPFVPAKYLEDILPPMASFFHFYDIDNDGLKDVITGDDRLVVYYNTSTNDSVKFSRKHIILKEKLPDGNYGINFQVGEQPTMADVDNDGLLDILIFDQNGERMLFYKNLSVSKTSILYELKAEKWGFFKESGINFDIVLGAAKKAHPGSKILAFDYENDGDMDLLISDISSTQVYFLENGKSDNSLPYDSMISSTQNFPDSNPINISYFPLFSLIDWDNDGDNDLVCSNSSRSPVKNGLIWLYENTAKQGYEFNLKSQSFLQESMIDLGIEASPTTFDFDGDGDLDLLVAAKNHKDANIFSDQIASLTLFENIGSTQNPVFALHTNDYLGLSSKAFELINPSFGDLDDDLVPDLVFGTGKGEVFFVKNNAKNGEAFNFNPIQKISSIDVGSNAAPLVIDVNNDGKNDLIIGELSGNLNYYKATGSLGFVLITENWGGVKTNTFYWSLVYDESGNVIDSSKQYLSIGNAHPSVADVNFDGNLDLVVGSAWGKIYYYEAISLDENSVFERVKDWYHNPYLAANFDKDLGEYSRPHLVDLNADGKYELLIGTYNGGLELFGTDSVPVSIRYLQAKQNKFLQVYPNPSSGIVMLENWGETEMNLEIYSIEGKFLQLTTLNPDQKLTLNFEPGLYILLNKSTIESSFYKLIVK